jgi:hypothetical protein
MSKGFASNNPANARIQVPLRVDKVQDVPPVERVSRSMRKTEPDRSPISGLLKRPVSPKPKVTRRTKIKLEAVGANASGISLDPAAPQTLNLSSTGTLPITAKGYPRGYPRNSLNKRISEIKKENK